MTTVTEGVASIGLIPDSSVPVVNVAQVPQRSLLRYPGGKTWLIPHIRVWLGSLESPRLLVEPFAGGGIVSLTAVMEDFVPGCLMVELDEDVAAFWVSALRHTFQFMSMIDAFTPTRDSVDALENREPATLLERGFRTLVLNRTRRGGILAKGASLTRSGENGKGVASRWYPDTLKHRLEDISRYAPLIDFQEGDGMEVMDGMLTEPLQPGVAFFVDPPYTAEGKRAGRRLYTHNCIDHCRLFNSLSQISDLGGDFLATYDESPEVLDLVSQYGLHAVRVLMKNTHHDRVSELVITNRRLFLE